MAALTLADTLEAQADDISIASETLKFLATLERKGKIPKRCLSKIRTLLKTVALCERKLRRFGKDDPELTKLIDEIGGF